MAYDRRPQQAMSWNTHTILTRAALRSLEEPLAAEEIRVTPLVTFLARVTTELPRLVEWYWDLLAGKTGVTRRTAKSPVRIITEPEFFAALRLNPRRPLSMVRALRPDEVAPESPHDHSRYGPPRNVYVETHVNESMTAAEMLATFSDEPDWGMDQDLFPIKEYSYGRAPFGLKTGKTSQAIFHMAFLHEPKWFLALIPGYRQSMMEERVRMHFALAKLAFEKGVDYWGWRFTAWAMHYLQDLTQPYHASMYPLSKIGTLRRFLLHPELRRLPLLIGMPLQKHHLVFEATVHFLLNDAVKKRWNVPLLAALAGDGDSCEGSISQVMTRISRMASIRARTLDRALVTLFHDPRLDDLSFVPGSTDETMDHVLHEAVRKRPAAFKRFVELVATCLVQTGRVTRYAVKWVRSHRQAATGP